MSRAAILFLCLITAGPAEAGCFLWWCPPARHRVHHRHYKRVVVVVHKHVTVVHKRVVVVRHLHDHDAARVIAPIAPLQ